MNKLNIEAKSILFFILESLLKDIPIPKKEDLIIKLNKINDESQLKYLDIIINELDPNIKIISEKEIYNDGFSIKSEIIYDLNNINNTILKIINKYMDIIEQS